MYRKKAHMEPFSWRTPYGLTPTLHTLYVHTCISKCLTSRACPHTLAGICAALCPPLHQSDSWWHFQHTHIKFSHIWCSDILFPHRCQSPPVRHKGKIKQITTSPVDSARPIRFFGHFVCLISGWRSGCIRLGFFFPRCLTKTQQAKLSDCYCDPDLDYLTSKITWHTVELPHSFMYS